MARRIGIALVAALTLLALALPAAAKEGAVTTFDSLPGQFVAGTSYDLGYTIRMDGVEPLKVDRTEIIARSLAGATYTFAGTPSGGPGHYVATVVFPQAGTYQWSVTQGPFFAPMQLPAISVQAATPVAAPTPATPAPAADPLRTALPLALAAAAAVLAWRLATRRHAPGVPRPA
ncbi:MAG: hypothetical protein ABR525_07285 [Candidatus Limnocylindria bacterium]